jgi:hypothetical protein
MLQEHQTQHIDTSNNYQKMEVIICNHNCRCYVVRGYATVSLYKYNHSYRVIKQATPTRQTAVTLGIGNSMSRCYVTARVKLGKGKKGGKESDV